MARRWHDHQSLVWLRPVMAATVVATMAMATGPVEAKQGSSEVLLALADDFLKGADPLANLRDRKAAIDDTFAKSGNYAFRIADLADRGSSVAVATDAASVSPDTLTLVPAAGVWLKLDAVAARFGEAKPSPSLPNAARRYRIAIDEDRSIVVELSGEPGRTGTRVTKLTAVRER